MRGECAENTRRMRRECALVRVISPRPFFLNHTNHVFFKDYAVLFCLCICICDSVREETRVVYILSNQWGCSRWAASASCQRTPAAGGGLVTSQVPQMKCEITKEREKEWRTSQAP